MDVGGEPDRSASRGDREVRVALLAELAKGPRWVAGTAVGVALLVLLPVLAVLPGDVVTAARFAAAAPCPEAEAAPGCRVELAGTVSARRSGSSMAGPDATVTRELLDVRVADAPPDTVTHRGVVVVPLAPSVADRVAPDVGAAVVVVLFDGRVVEVAGADGRRVRVGDDPSTRIGPLVALATAAGTVALVGIVHLRRRVRAGAAPAAATRAASRLPRWVAAVAAVALVTAPVVGAFGWAAARFVGPAAALPTVGAIILVAGVAAVVVGRSRPSA